MMNKHDFLFIVPTSAFIVSEILPAAYWGLLFTFFRGLVIGQPLRVNGVGVAFRLFTD
jgi:hypothetical protein